MPSGEILLKVGSQSFITSRDIPVQPGTRIQLEVHQIDPRLILKVVNQINVGPALQTPDRFNSTHFNQHTPGVSEFVDLLKNLPTVRAGRLLGRLLRRRAAGTFDEQFS